MSKPVALFVIVEIAPPVLLRLDEAAKSITPLLTSCELLAKNDAPPVQSMVPLLVKVAALNSLIRLI